MATELRSVQVGEVRLQIAEAGAGGRPLLLVHGFTGAKEDFTDFLDRLAERGWHAVAPDLRGHGSSDHPDGDASYSLDRFRADLVALIDALGWERVVLLGHSMGGMIAQHLVLSSPGRLNALVLMDTAHGALEWIDADTLVYGAGIAREQGMAALLEAQNAMRDEDPLVTPAFLRLLRERPGYAEFCDSKLLNSAPAMWLAMTAEMVAQPDRLDRLAALDLPVLVIVGELDTPFIDHAERMAKTIPGARLVTVPDAGHSPQFENPGVWWDAMTAFLDDLA